MKESGPEPGSSNDHGGWQALRWSKDGKKLFFIEEDTLMAVDVTTSPVFAPISTTPLFSDAHLVAQTLMQITYDVSADGRFVLIDAVGDEPVKPPSIHVTENWHEEFRGATRQQR